MRDEFLGEEDLDLARLSFEELVAWWNAWMLQAQCTNDEDADLYAHGVFQLVREPGRGQDSADGSIAPDRR